MSDNNTQVRSFRPRRLSWLTIALAVLTVITFIAVSRPDIQYAVPMMGGAREGVTMDSSGSSGGALPPTASKVAPDMYYPYPYPTPEVPITDVRELLKVYYSATMRTRDVQGLTRRVETTVRGYSGRIDQQSSSQYYGSVSFAIPANKYDAFRDELEGLVNSRLITTNISSQNLLPQKLSIEEQQKQAVTTLATYKAERQKLITIHTSAVQALQVQIDQSTDQNILVTLRQQLASENASHALRLSAIESSIKSTEEWQKALQTQDQTLLDNVATVTGTVSLQWISLWDMARLYLPGYWIPAIFALLTFLSLLWDRKRFGTV